MKRKKDIENSIIHLTCLLNKLRIKIDDSDEYNVGYNRLLIQRAELRKKLTESKTSNIIELFANKLNKLSPGKSKSKEKLICDYFS